MEPFRPRNSLLLICLMAAAPACHRPMPQPGQALVYPPRPVAEPEGSDPVAQAFAERLGDPGSRGGQSLDPAAARRLALENHPGVRVARLAVAQAAASVRSAGLWPNPELGGRLLVDMDASVEGEAALLFALPLAGRVGAAEQLALAKLDATRLDLMATRTRALLEVDRLLVRLAHVRARIDVARRLAQRAGANLALARTRLDAQMADPIEVALLAAEETRNRREVIRLSADRDALIREVQLALGLAPGGTELTTEPLQVGALAEGEQALAQAALKNAPAVLRARLATLVADRLAGLRAAERAPDLMLGPAMAGSGDHLALGVSLGLALPVLQSGREHYEEALAQRDRAQEAYQQACRAAVSGTLQALDLLRTRSEALALLQGEAGRQVAAAVDLAEERFAAGRMDVLKLLSLYQALLTIEAEALDLKRDWALARLELEERIGRPIRMGEVL